MSYYINYYGKPKSVSEFDYYIWIKDVSNYYLDLQVLELGDVICKLETGFYGRIEGTNPLPYILTQDTFIYPSEEYEYAKHRLGYRVTKFASLDELIIEKKGENKGLGFSKLQLST